MTNRQKPTLTEEEHQDLVNYLVHLEGVASLATAIR